MAFVGIHLSWRQIDLRILDLLQRDCSLSLNAIAVEVGLSSTPCWRRIQKLEADGVIRGRVARLDAARLGLGMTVFVSLRTARHDAAWLEEVWRRRLLAMPEVVEVNRLAGHWDYLLRVLVADMAAYDGFYKALIELEGLADVTSAFSMEQVKYTTACRAAGAFLAECHGVCREEWENALKLGGRHSLRPNRRAVL